MPSNFNLNKASFGLKFGAIVGILFLHIPLFLIILYAFTTEDKSYQFPPPGYTLKWFSIVLSREDIWSAVYLSLHAALVSTFAAIILGTLAAAALYKADFFGKQSITLLIILPPRIQMSLSDLWSSHLRSTYNFAIRNRVVGGYQYFR